VSTFDNTSRGKWIIRKDGVRWVAYQQPLFGEIVGGDAWRWDSFLAPLWGSFEKAVAYMVMRMSD
jgi:hypothetical protein